jgi:3-phosphoinositide dependent protein kinase-1
MNKLSKDDFIFEEKLGEGSFSTVYKTKLKNSNLYYATKVLDKRQLIKLKKVEEVKNEKTILLELNHPNVICLHHTYQDDYNLCKKIIRNKRHGFGFMLGRFLYY